MDSQPDS